MARKDNKINMPMSTAGITRYFDEYNSKITLQPSHVLMMVGLIVIIVIMLHVYGNALLGLS